MRRLASRSWTAGGLLLLLLSVAMAYLAVTSGEPWELALAGLLLVSGGSCLIGALWEGVDR